MDQCYSEVFVVYVIHSCLWTTSSHFATGHTDNVLSPLQIHLRTSILPSNLLNHNSFLNSLSHSLIFRCPLLNDFCQSHTFKQPLCSCMELASFFTFFLYDGWRCWPVNFLQLILWSRFWSAFFATDFADFNQSFLNLFCSWGFILSWFITTICPLPWCKITFPSLIYQVVVNNYFIKIAFWHQMGVFQV